MVPDGSAAASCRARANLRGLFRQRAGLRDRDCLAERELALWRPALRVMKLRRGLVGPWASGSAVRARLAADSSPKRTSHTVHLQLRCDAQPGCSMGSILKESSPVASAEACAPAVECRRYHTRLAMEDYAGARNNNLHPQSASATAGAQHICQHHGPQLRESRRSPDSAQPVRPVKDEARAPSW